MLGAEGAVAGLESDGHWIAPGPTTQGAELSTVAVAETTTAPLETGGFITPIRYPLLGWH
jgi:hypothetical protein